MQLLNYFVNWRFQKLCVKTENISVRSPFVVCGLRVAYCIHIQRSELSLRMGKKKISLQ